MSWFLLTLIASAVWGLGTLNDKVFMSKYFKDPLRFCERLSEILSPNNVILRALSSIGRRDRYVESDNALGAVNELYRFIVLGDPKGWLGFIKGLYECYQKLANSENTRERERAKRYLSMISILKMY